MKILKFAVPVIAVIGVGYAALTWFSKGNDDAIQLDQPQSTDGPAGVKAAVTVPLPQVSTELQQLPASNAVGVYIPNQQGGDSVASSKSR